MHLLLQDVVAYCVGIEFVVGPAIHVVDEDHLSAVVQLQSQTQVVHKGLLPRGVLGLCSTEAGPCEDEVVVVSVVALFVHESRDVVEESEVHAGDEEGLGFVHFGDMVGLEPGLLDELGLLEVFKDEGIG